MSEAAKFINASASTITLYSKHETVKLFKGRYHIRKYVSPEVNENIIIKDKQDKLTPQDTPVSFYKYKVKHMILTLLTLLTLTVLYFPQVIVITLDFLELEGKTYNYFSNDLFNYYNEAYIAYKRPISFDIIENEQDISRLRYDSSTEYSSEIEDILNQPSNLSHKLDMENIIYWALIIGVSVLVLYLIWNRIQGDSPSICSKSDDSSEAIWLLRNQIKESITNHSDVNETMLLIDEMRDKAINRINSTSTRMSTSNNIERLEEVINSNLSPNTKFPAIDHVLNEIAQTQKSYLEQPLDVTDDSGLFQLFYPNFTANEVKDLSIDYIENTKLPKEFKNSYINTNIPRIEITPATPIESVDNISQLLPISDRLGDVHDTVNSIITTSNLVTYVESSNEVNSTWLNDFFMSMIHWV
jgi:hypothetical protein